MTDRLNEIKERLDKVDVCSVKHYICAGCEGDIETTDARWLIAELEKERAKIITIIDEEIDFWSRADVEAIDPETALEHWKQRREELAKQKEVGR